VLEDELAARGTLRAGEGTIVVSRRRPLVTLLALVEHAVRTRSRWGREAPREAGSGAALLGLRSTRFPEKVVLWNRTAEEKVVVLGEDTMRPPIVLAAGALAGLDLRSGRILGGAS
jgi:hypothetical protein